jgi:hypothetical protein
VTCEVLRSVYLPVLGILHYSTIDTFYNDVYLKLLFCWYHRLHRYHYTEMVFDTAELSFKIACSLPFYLRSVCGAGIILERP